MNELSHQKILRKTRDRLRSNSGFTLVEILIATFILGVVSMAAFNFYQNQHNQYLRQTEVSDAQQNLRVTLQELTRQIRLAGYGVFGQPAIRISAEGDALQVTYSDGATVHNQAYFVFQSEDSSRNLVTVVDGGIPQVFAEGIDSISFVGGGSGAGIQWITIDVLAKVDHTEYELSKGDLVRRGPYLYRRVSSTIRLRNR